MRMSRGFGIVTVTSPGISDIHLPVLGLPGELDRKT